MDFAVDIDHVPCCLKLSDVAVTQQSVFLVGVEERKVLHDDRYQNTHQTLSIYSDIRRKNCRENFTFFWKISHHFHHIFPEISNIFPQLEFYYMKTLNVQQIHRNV